MLRRNVLAIGIKEFSLANNSKYLTFLSFRWSNWGEVNVGVPTAVNFLLWNGVIGVWGVGWFDVEYFDETELLCFPLLLQFSWEDEKNISRAEYGVDGGASFTVLSSTGKLASTFNAEAAFSRPEKRGARN